MTWTLIPILVMVAMIIALRLAAWWGLHLVFRLFSKSKTVLKQVQVINDISGLGSRIRVSFPETTRLLLARLTPSRYTGLPLTLIVIAALYIAALLGGLVEELLEADKLVRLDREEDENVFMNREFVYGTDGRAEVAFAVPHLIYYANVA